MAIPPEVRELAERFQRNQEAYASGQYKEAQLRCEFIDPFFECLGWDVNNKRGYAEAYKDVIHEDAIKIGGATKAPDYCFRIGGTRKFFVEAKKPSVDIKDAVHPAYQLRRYAWSAKLPLSILTDFEEFAAYDCRTKPGNSDKASTARVFYLTYTDYIPRWEEIASIFSRDAVLKGSFDKYVESTKRKRGTAEVDAAFLKEIESWRESLARNIALRNPDLTRRELNFAVQRTIDRIIFLRICEDRGVEHYGQLMALQNGTEVYARLCKLFYRADERYNSGLFYFRAEKGRADTPDELTPHLTIDDKPLKEIVRRLYYPESPYEFSVLPADILGQVYEQFLGKVIRLTPAHRAVVEDKPEVKKAGGVYYTPSYIVDYIVKNTVGKLLGAPEWHGHLGHESGEARRGARDKSRAGRPCHVTPPQASRIRILDPACGSGSFLIGAYQSLLDWHLNWYTTHNPEKWARKKNPPIYQTPSARPPTPNPRPLNPNPQTPSPTYRLTTSERKRILLNNIYGVDIDPQAVEVTKLSLLLKVLEGQSQQTIDAQYRFFRERALPDLSSNIKCGNSLIGPDFYDNQQMTLLDDEERYRINAFDWNAEFPEIMKSGGFHAVIGNPPYVRMEGFKVTKAYLKSRYASHDERSDLYAYFIERAHTLLNRRGRFGMIVSNKFLRANYGRRLREFLNQNATIERIVDFAGLPVFGGATVRTIVLLSAREEGRKHPMLYSPPLSLDKFYAVQGTSMSVGQAIADSTYEVTPSTLAKPVWSLAKREVEDLLNRLKTISVPLAEYCDGQICMGVKSGLTQAFVIDADTRRAILKRNRKAEELIKPFLNGRHVRRYHIAATGLYLIYTYHGLDIQKYPAIEQHLKPFKDRLRRRATRQPWYELQQPQYNFAPYMDGPKIIFPDIATRPRFALDEAGYYGSNTTYFIPRPDSYLLGLLNSRLGRFYFVKTCAGLEGKTATYLRFFGQYLEGFPTPRIDLSDRGHKARHDRMVKLVERMLDLHKKLAAAKTGHDKTVLQRQIDKTDKQIDQLVYELYDLTEEEIKIVEEAAPRHQNL